LDIGDLQGRTQEVHWKTRWNWQDQI
jgi:hypothetical protein